MAQGNPRRAHGAYAALHASVRVRDQHIVSAKLAREEYTAMAAVPAPCAWRPRRALEPLYRRDEALAWYVA
jgi:hypothetical protein